MALEAKAIHEKPSPQEPPFAHLRATSEERARILTAAPAFDVEAWGRDRVSPTPEELADLEDFLRELEEMRQSGLERERLAELSE